MKCIVYQQPGEPAARLFPNPAVQFDGESEADFFASIAAKDVPDGLPFTIMEADDPAFADRTFRDAWTFDGAKVDYDMPKAAVIAIERIIRPARDAELLKTDREFEAAVLTGDPAEINKVYARKAALRDLPANIAAELRAAATPADLLARVPDMAAVGRARRG